MSLYLANYWTLYQEFIQTFKNLTFMNIPIALLTNFYQQIDDSLRIQMENEDFSKKMKFPVMKQDMIQPFFERWLNKLNSPIQNKENGKVLINFDYTRLTERNYKKWFDPNQTIILSRSKGPRVYGIPNEFIGNYFVAEQQTSDDLVKKAKHIFGKFENHPAFSNEFFQTTFLNRIPLILQNLKAVFNLYDSLDISFLVVGTTEDVLSRSLSIVGMMKGIRSFCLQHGILMGEEAFMPVFTTDVAVYSEYEKDWYSKRGLAEHRIAPIGHPKYDELISYSSDNNENILKSLGLNPKKKTLLVITGPNIDAAKFRILMSNLAADSKFQLIIKPHPWELSKGKCLLYLELEKQFNSLKAYTKKGSNLYELISQTDGVVSTLSTVGTESILLNKPVFIFNFLNSNRVYDYYDHLGEFTQKDPHKLSEIVEKYFSSDAKKEEYHQIRKEFLSQSYMNGSSGEKLIQLLKQNPSEHR